MKLLKSLAAVVALAAICGMVTAATALALPLILPEKVLRFTGVSTGEVKLESTKVLSIACIKSKLEVELEAGKPSGLYRIVFEGCKDLMFNCTGLAEMSGVIAFLGTVDIVYDSLSPLGAALLYLIETTHYECVGLVLLHGSILCLIKSINSKVKTMTETCSQASKGKPSETAYWNDSEEQLKAQLLQSISGGANEEAAWSLTAELTLQEEAEVMA